MIWPIFPENGLANSVIPPVLAGLTFSTFFVETLGWNFSGLIVPGYLAPILVVRPFSGIVIIAEALLTYVILRLLADGLSRMGIWTRFFGQDAFFALLCISILVKCTVEGPLQATIGGMLSQIMPGEFDFHNELHSTGLIVVPLLANIFWRHGIRRNLLPTLTNIILTYVFLKFVLIPYTNFSVNKFELMYSKMAVNFEESARYYVILLIGAALANHNKYRFGWSYHGILIPALLGIAWLTPVKILTTFVEALCILTIGVWLVKSRLMRNRTIEGPRKLLLLFFIGFALKMITGFTLQSSLPGFSAMDVYGFAYILPALLAMEMWPGRKVLQVTRITLQTSLLAAVAGLAISTGLQVLSPETFMAQSETRQDTAAGSESDRIREIEQDLLGWLEAAEPRHAGWGVQQKNLTLKTLKLMDETLLTPLVRALAEGTLPQDAETGMQRVLKRTGYELIRLTDPSDGGIYYILTETSAGNFRGTYVFRAGNAQPLTIQVPQPKSEEGTLPIGIALFRNQNARALLISGSSRRKDFAEFDVTHLSCKRSLFQLVHQVIHRENADIDPILTIQVRGAADLDQAGVDAVISNGGESRDGETVSTRLQQFRDTLEHLDLRIRFFRSDQSDVHLSSHSNTQQAYVETFNLGEFAVAWFDNDFRRSFSEIEPDAHLIETLGWTTLEGDLAEWVSRSVKAPATTNPGSPAYPDAEPGHWNDLRTDINVELTGYSSTGNVIHLQRLTALASQNGYRLNDFLDLHSGRHVLVFEGTGPDALPYLLCNYFPHTDRFIPIPPEPYGAVRNALNRFSFSHVAYAIPSGETP